MDRAAQHSPSRNMTSKIPPLIVPSLRSTSARAIVMKKMRDGKISCPIQKNAKPVRNANNGKTNPPGISVYIR